MNNDHDGAMTGVDQSPVLSVTWLVAMIANTVVIKVIIPLVIPVESRDGKKTLLKKLPQSRLKSNAVPDAGAYSLNYSGLLT